MTFDKDTTEFSSLTKKIKQIDTKIHNLDKKKLVEKKFSHSHSHTDTLDKEIKQLLAEKRDLLKRKNKIAKIITKHNSKTKP